MDYARTYPGCDVDQLLEDAKLIGNRMHLELDFCEVCEEQTMVLSRQEVFLDEYFLTRFDPSYAEWRLIRKTRENFYFKLLNAEQYAARHYVTGKFLTERIMVVDKEWFSALMFDSMLEMKNVDWVKCYSHV